MASETMKETLRRLRRGAAAGDPEQQGALGYRLAEGRGVRKNLRQAFEWFRRSAEAGNTTSKHNLAICYRDGDGTRRDVGKAWDWFLAAARDGHRDAAYRAIDLIEDKLVRRSARLVLPHLRAIAAAGDADAQVTYGVHCFEGDGVRRDWPQALHWYRLAAAQGERNALCNLGHMHRNGHGVQADLRAAMSCYRRAAARGHGGAAMWLARCHEGGRMEFPWWRRAVSLGSTEAMYGLAVRYHYGVGCRVDLLRSVRLLWSGVRRKDVDCVNMLAGCMLTGSGVRRDPRAAHALYGRAAALGDAWAMYQLGDCHRDGVGVPKHIGRARAWWRKAAALGCREANRALAKSQR